MERAIHAPSHRRSSRLLPYNRSLPFQNKRNPQRLHSDPPVYRITATRSYYYSGVTLPPPPDHSYPTIPLPLSSSPPPPPVLHHGSYHDADSPPPYYSGHDSSAPPPPRPLFDRTMGNYGSGPFT
ncbi:hypothetical protein OIU79_006028, partial [Salix purpurea]